ncbi:MAG: hypothetical protein ACPGVU_12800 [Limisphaerales bacterium]
MKHKLRYNRNYTVTLIPESNRRKPKNWPLTATWCVMLIATTALSIGSMVVALAEPDPNLTPPAHMATGSVLGS